MFELLPLEHLYCFFYVGTVFLVIPQGLPLQSGTVWTCLGLPSAIMDTSIDESLSSIDGTSEATPIDLSEATDDGPLSSLVESWTTGIHRLKTLSEVTS